jgi:hypothetical protein
VYYRKIPPHGGYEKGMGKKEKCEGKMRRDKI